MHDIAQKQIFFKKLPELDPDPDLVVKFPDPDPQHCIQQTLVPVKLLVWVEAA
jgi:hypothetical protein